MVAYFVAHVQVKLKQQLSQSQRCVPYGNVARTTLTAAASQGIVRTLPILSEEIQGGGLPCEIAGRYSCWRAHYALAEPWAAQPPPRFRHRRATAFPVALPRCSKARRRVPRQRRLPAILQVPARRAGKQYRLQDSPVPLHRTGESKLATHVARGNDLRKGVPHGHRGRHARAMGRSEQVEIPLPQTFDCPVDAIL